MIAATLLTLALAADPSPNTMKGLLKDAAQSSGEAVDGGAVLQNGLDVSKMRFGPESVMKVVMSYKPQIQSCQEEVMAGSKKVVEGVLKTHFVITPEGMVKGARIEKKGTTLKDPRVQECVLTVLSTMTFPKPDDKKDTPIDFPFNLKAEK
jgi:hypothetical protein